MDYQQSSQNTQSSPPPAGPGQGAGGHGFLKQMEEFFNTYLHKKAPFHLPPHAKEWIVKFGPWITLVLMVIAIPVILAALGLSALFTPFAMVYGGFGFGALFIISGLISLLALILQAMALPGMFARSLKGWYLVYYAALVSAVGQVLHGQIIGMIIGLAISLFILFEIKEYYK